MQNAVSICIPPMSHVYQTHLLFIISLCKVRNYILNPLHDLLCILEVYNKDDKHYQSEIYSKLLFWKQHALCE